MSDITKQTTLIVDDSASYASVLRKILEAGLGMKDVVHCSSVTEAEALILDDPGRFSLLFIDYRFPTGGNGVDLLEKLSGKLPESTLKFLITSEPNPDNVKRAMVAGAKGVVAKPFDRSQLTQQLERALRKDEDSAT